MAFALSSWPDVQARQRQHRGTAHTGERDARFIAEPNHITLYASLFRGHE
jgi:hypothetical protein